MLSWRTKHYLTDGYDSEPCASDLLAMNVLRIAKESNTGFQLARRNFMHGQVSVIPARTSGLRDVFQQFGATLNLQPERSSEYLSHHYRQCEQLESLRNN